MSDKKYFIKSLAWMVRNETSVKFHIENDDYFGTMAAILDLIKQQLEKDECYNALMIRKTLKNLEKDLLFLQNNYQIKPKTKKRKMIPKGKDNNQ